MINAVRLFASLPSFDLAADMRDGARVEDRRFPVTGLIDLCFRYRETKANDKI